MLAQIRSRKRLLAIGAAVLVVFLIVTNLFNGSGNAGQKLQTVSDALEPSNREAMPESSADLYRQDSANSDLLLSQSNENTGSTALGGAAAPTDSEGKAQQPQQPGAAPSQANERLVIKNANVEALIDYKQMRLASTQIENMVLRLGGFIVSTDDASSNDEAQAYISLAFRVPADQFEKALNAFEENKLEVVRREVSGQDVTEEFVDNQSRLANLEATAARIRELLAKAETIAETIQINETLAQYESQIEVIKGRQKFLSDSASMSLVTLMIRPKATEYSILTTLDIGQNLRNALARAEKPAWTPLAAATGAWDDVLEIGKDLAETLVVWAVWIPIWLPLLLVAWFGWRKWRKYSQSQNTPINTPNPTVNQP
ncbi:DUF4349 domain-containing protein [Herpetosiphon llansteffanensis]